MWYAVKCKMPAGEASAVEICVSYTPVFFLAVIGTKFFIGHARGCFVCSNRLETPPVGPDLEMDSFWAEQQRGLSG